MRVRRATIVVRVVLSEGLTAQEDDLLKRVQHKLRPEQLQQKVNALLMGESTVERLFVDFEQTLRKGPRSFVLLRPEGSAEVTDEDLDGWTTLAVRHGRESSEQDEPGAHRFRFRFRHHHADCTGLRRRFVGHREDTYVRIRSRSAGTDTVTTAID